MIIDCHLHLIKNLNIFCGKGEGMANPEAGRIDFPNGEVMNLLPVPKELGNNAFLAEDALKLMKENHIDKAVLVQAGFYGYQNQYYYEVAKKYPDIFYPAGAVDPFCSGAMDIVRNLVENWGFRILKFECSEGTGLCSIHPDFRVDAPYMEEIYQYAAEHDVAVVFDLGGKTQRSYQLQALKRMITKYRNLRFVVCHLLCPAGPDLPYWESDLKTVLADNVWLDISTVPVFCGEQYPFPGALRYIEKAVEMAGKDKVMWGSDAPGNLSLIPDMSKLLDYLQHSTVLTSGELDAILGENVAHAYNLNV